MKTEEKSQQAEAAHAQPKDCGTVCRAAAADGITCPSDSCDIEDGVRAEAAPVASAEPVLAVELQGVAEEMAEGGGFWMPCSGCHETEDGHAVGNYSYSHVFKCALGSGCSECGGIGAVWDNTDYEEMGRDWMREESEREAFAQAAPAPADEAIAEFGRDSIFIIQNQPNGERWPEGTKLYTRAAPAPEATAPVLGYISEDAKGMLEAGRPITMSVRLNKDGPWTVPIYLAAPVASQPAQSEQPELRMATTELSLPELVNELKAVEQNGWDWTFSPGVCGMIARALDGRASQPAGGEEA